MKNNIACLIIDDEPLARQLLHTYLLNRPGYILVAECATPAEAYEPLLNNDIDVIFLDIQMPVLTGIEFLRTLKKPPAIIFTTAFDQYAAIAFDLNVIDYLMKPITEERFDQALSKLKAALQKREPYTFLPTGEPGSTSVFFKTDGRLVKVILNDILYLEALKDFTKIFIKDQPTLLIGDHLKAVELLLPVKDFMRIHRSYTIRLSAVTGLFGNTVQLGGVELPVGGSYKQDLLDSLKIS